MGLAYLSLQFSQVEGIIYIGRFDDDQQFEAHSILCFGSIVDHNFYMWPTDQKKRRLSIKKNGMQPN